MTENNTAVELASELASDTQYEEEQVAKAIQQTAEEFSIPKQEAARVVKQEYGMGSSESTKETRTDSEEQESKELSNFNPTPISNINEKGEWHDIHVTVLYLWETSHKNMEQVGLLGGETANIKFVSWSNDDGVPPVQKLEEGESYLISNVVTDEYNGNYSVELKDSSKVVKTDDNPTTKEIEGIFTEMQNGSGIIKRCTKDDCGRPVRNNTCYAHGKLEEHETEHDLRIKAIIDDGETAHQVIYQREAAEKVLGMTLDDAKQLAMESLDTKAVEEEIEDLLLGSYISMEGPVYGDYVIVEDHEILGGPTNEEIREAQSQVQDEQAQSPTGKPEAATQNTESATQ